MGSFLVTELAEVKGCGLLPVEDGEVTAPSFCFVLVPAAGGAQSIPTSWAVEEPDMTPVLTHWPALSPQCHMEGKHVSVTVSH